MRHWKNQPQTEIIHSLAFSSKVYCRQSLTLSFFAHHVVNDHNSRSTYIPNLIYIFHSWARYHTLIRVDNKSFCWRDFNTDIVMGGRISMLSNRTDGTLWIKERQFCDGYNMDGIKIKVDAGCRCDDFAATTFKTRNHYSNRPSAIILSVDDVEYSPSLTPEHFLPYAELIFEFHDGVLMISGVRAKLSDVSRLWGFGFLGRDYSQRKKEPIYYSLRHPAPIA